MLPIERNPGGQAASGCILQAQPTPVEAHNLPGDGETKAIVGPGIVGPAIVCLSVVGFTGAGFVGPVEALKGRSLLLIRHSHPAVPHEDVQERGGDLRLHLHVSAGRGVLQGVAQQDTHHLLQAPHRR